MIISIPLSDLTLLVEKQLNNFFLDIDISQLKNNIPTTLERLEICLNKVKSKYCHIENETYFSPYNSTQYGLFLYYLSNTIYRTIGRNSLSDQIYYLNKIMNSVDWYYEISLPNVFYTEHPIGSVLGRATYSNNLFIYQGVTIGGNKGIYPVIGENVLLYSNSSVLGNSHIGDNVVISCNTLVKDENIPSNSIVFGQTPNLIIKLKNLEHIKSMSAHIWDYNKED